MPRTRFPQGHPRYGGRTHGTPNKATALRKEAEAKVMAEMSRVTSLTPEEMAQLTPLNVMLMAMVARWRMGDLAGAVVCAAAAAPYCHPKLSQSDVTVRHEVADKTTEELLAEARQIEARISAHQPVH